MPTADTNRYAALLEALRPFAALSLPEDFIPKEHQEPGDYPDESEADCFVRRGSIRAARSALAGAGWQPIDTAPKDGREVLLYTEGSAVVAWWCDYYGTPYGRGHSRWFTGFTCADDGPHFVDRPTHWMEVPPPPPKVHP